MVPVPVSQQRVMMKIWLKMKHDSKTLHPHISSSGVLIRL